MNIDAISLLCCPSCSKSFPASPTDTALRVFSHHQEGRTQRVRDGALQCTCGVWFRIENQVLDLRPVTLRDATKQRAFGARYGLPDSNTGASADAAGEGHKLWQQEYFGHDAEDYERDVVQSTFYQALDAMTVQKWMDRLKPGSLVLDVAAGSCRTTIPLALRGHHVFAIDLAEPLLNIGQEKARDAGVAANVEFLLADAEALPFPAASFDAALCHGALHHLDAPERAIREVGRVLKAGGHWFSLDPNKSPMRWLFDLAMKVRTLWVEEASDHPLQTEQSLRAWCTAAGIEANVRYTCYILPHLLTRLNPRQVRSCLEFTDRMFARLGPLTRWAGVVYVEGQKRDRSSVADARATAVVG